MEHELKGKVTFLAVGMAEVNAIEGEGTRGWRTLL